MSTRISASASASTSPALPFLLLTGLSAGGLMACGTEDQGTLVLTAYGETFIEEGIPASDVDDGWAIQFSHFRVSLADVAVGGEAISAPPSVDLTQPSSGTGQTLGSIPVSEGEYTKARFTLSRVEVEGTATKTTTTKSFDWVFDRATQYHDCDAKTRVKANAQATFQVTVHADHLFYDSLVSEAPQILFQPLADADEDNDGNITASELATRDIGSYDPGSEGGINDLWAWLNALATTLGHADGEGHCHATVLP